MKLIHYALAFMLLLTACSKDDENTDGKTDESFPSSEFMWTRDSSPFDVIIDWTDAYLKGGEGYYAQHYRIWLDYGEIGSLQEIDIYNIPILSYDENSSIPIREKHGYIRKYWETGAAASPGIDYTAYLITEIHRDKDGNILYIKGQQRDFEPYKRWL